MEKLKILYLFISVLQLFCVKVASDDRKIITQLDSLHKELEQYKKADSSYKTGFLSDDEAFVYMDSMVKEYEFIHSNCPSKIGVEELLKLPFKTISFETIKKITINKIELITITLAYIMSKTSDTIITDTCNAERYQVKRGFIVSKFDSQKIGYKITSTSIPAELIEKTIKNPRTRKIANGGYGCVEWGYLIINDLYRVRVPCGYFITEPALILIFNGEKEAIECKYDLNNVPELKSKSEVTEINKYSENYKKYLPFLTTLSEYNIKEILK